MLRTRGRGQEVNEVRGFTIYEKETGRGLATLPLTIPIGATVEGFERAGYEVGWTWAVLEREGEL
jgi:hypothetical protein